MLLWMYLPFLWQAYATPVYSFNGVYKEGK